MPDNVVSLAKQFVAIRSDPGNRKELDRILKLAVSQLKGFPIERFESRGVKSILAHNAKRAPAKFKVLLNGHLDVIPGKDGQYIPRIRNGRLYGVGSMDMKANVACLIDVFKRTAGKVPYPLGLQLVTDEEIGGFNGTKHQVDSGVRADFVIAGESTHFDIVNEAKGVLWLKISCRGRTAHGAYPWRGENAVTKMNRFLGKLLEEFPVPKRQEWRSTVNLSRIETRNRSFNKVPDDCEAWLDLRYVPEESGTILSRVRRLVPRGFSIEVIAKEPALYVEPGNLYLKTLRKVSERAIGRRVRLYGAQGTSDARHFTRVGCAGVEFGPIGEGIGTDDEWISIPSLARYRKILTEFLLEL